MVFKFIQTVRKNPKKSVFGAVVAGYVANWLNDVHNNHLFRHTMCQSIQFHDSVTVPSIYEPKRITILLNPAANNGKSTKMFEKNAAPVLDLSGCHVDIVRLSANTTKQLMLTLEDTDLIVAAGGDGTINEVVTGILRRPDSEKFCKKPFGIIPLGKNNTIYRTICRHEKSDTDAQSIVKATVDLLNPKSRQVDLMEIKSDNGKTAYALSRLTWGSYRDAFVKTGKYWYFGSLKKYAAFVFTSFRSHVSNSRELDLSYSDPLPVVETDDLDCQQNIISATQNTVVSNLMKKIFNKYIFSWFYSAEVENAAENNIEEKSAPESEEIPVEFNDPLNNIKTLEFNATINLHNPDEKRETASSHLSIESEHFDRMSFIQNGPGRFVDGKPNSIDSQHEIDCDTFKINPKDADGTFFSIDSEEYEAMPCTVRVIRNKIKLIYAH